MKKVFFIFTSCLISFSSADNIRGVDIDFVTISNTGNPADTQVMVTDGTSGYGAVGYDYRIGKYEVTNAQWNAFTAAAGVPTGNDGGSGDSAYDQSVFFIGALQPTNNVSWYETLQFCNYLTSGDKSKGVYQFSGNNTNPGTFLGIDRNAAKAIYGTIYFLPTENEWYKAAYYKPDGSGYSFYANGSNIAPIAGVQSNWDTVIGIPWNVGTGTPEQNGTFDMMGNVYEWNETLVANPSRGLRGGSYGTTGDGLASSDRFYKPPFQEVVSLGFRVASIPEACTLLLLGLGGLLIRKH